MTRYEYDENVAAQMVADLKALDVWEISGMSEFQYSPDTSTSAGTGYLTNIRDGVAQELDNKGDELLVSRDFTDTSTRIADSALTGHSHGQWLTFVDLGAYYEPNDLGSHEPQDMCTSILVTVGERLAEALFERACEMYDSLMEDTEDDPIEDDAPGS